MKIIKLTTENTKRLRAVEISPTGDLVVIGGRNGQGKSSVLDSIEMALHGGDSIPPMPVRKGAEKAKTVVELDDLIVTRTFTAAGGTSLVVKTKDGKPQLSPQGILDKMVGRLSFDPLAFAREPVKKQGETLRAIAGLDFTKLDQDKNKLMNERLLAGRDRDTAKGALDSCPLIPDAPPEEQSASEILTEQRRASETNAANEKARSAVESAQRTLREGLDIEAEMKQKITDLKQQVIDHEAALAKQQASLQNHKRTLGELRATMITIKDIDLSQFATMLATVEQLNDKVRQNKRHAELDKTHKAKAKAYDDLTRKIEALDEQKRTATESAKMPVPGLSFTAIGGVALNGIPLEQASSAEQLRVSVAIGLALNPKLRVLLIRDGSLLDDESMGVLAEMAKKAKAQVWIERVETDGHTSVVIEDGMVKESEAQPEQKELV